MQSLVFCFQTTGRKQEQAKPQIIESEQESKKENGIRFHCQLKLITAFHS